MEYATYTEVDTRNKLIVKANTLIEAKYHLSVREQKFIIFLASLVDRHDTDFKYTSIKIKDIETALKGGEDKKWGSIYDVVKEVVLSISKKPLSIRKPNGGWTIISWFSSIDADPDKGIVTFKLSEDIKIQLVKLNEYFTKYRFGNVLNLKSGYSIRIYELLKLNQFKGRVRYELSHFRELIGISYLDESQEWVHKYPTYKEFKRSIIKYTQKELKAKTDIYFELKEEREGRSVKFLTFYMFKNNQRKVKVQNELFSTSDDMEILDEEDATLISENIIEAMIKLGLTRSKALKMYKNGFNTIQEDAVRKEIVKQGRTLDEYFLEKIEYVRYQIKNSEVANPAGLLTKAIQENYQSKVLEKQRKIKETKARIKVAAEHKEKLQKKLHQLKNDLLQKEMDIANDLVESMPSFLENLLENEHPQLWMGYDIERTLIENYKAPNSPTLRYKFLDKIKKVKAELFIPLKVDLQEIDLLTKQIRSL